MPDLAGINNGYSLLAICIAVFGIVVIVFRVTAKLDRFEKVKVSLKDGVELDDISPPTTQTQSKETKIEKNFNFFVEDFKRFSFVFFDFICDVTEIKDKSLFAQMFSLHIRSDLQKSFANCIALNHIPPENTKEFDEYCKIRLKQLADSCILALHLLGYDCDYKHTEYDFKEIIDDFKVLILRYKQ
jgi:hypothetical protein